MYKHLPFGPGSDTESVNSDAELHAYMAAQVAVEKREPPKHGPLVFDNLMNMNPRGAYTPTQLALIKPRNSWAPHHAGVRPGMPAACSDPRPPRW